MPSVLFHIIGNTVFLRLSDALQNGSKLRLATYLQTLLAYPEACTRGEMVLDPRSEDIIVQMPPLSARRLYPKEKALMDLVAAHRLEGRRVLVYATHTGTRDITGRMDDILTRHGFQVAMMKAEAVAPGRREAWVADRVKQGIDVLICHPRLVQTGLALIDFPTICWYEKDYSVYVMRQASRRSWRIGQTRLVKVVFMSCRNALQAAGEPEKGRESVFAWAEFLTGEPVKRRNGQAYADEVKYIVGGDGVTPLCGCYTQQNVPSGPSYDCCIYPEIGQFNEADRGQDDEY